MKLSAKTEYALLAMIFLSEKYGSGFLKISNIAENKNIPRKFLEQILLSLKRAGYLKSRRGADGGYMLALPPSEISLAEIIRLFDGPLAPVESVSRYFYEHTPLEQDQRFIQVFREIRDYISDKLESTTFEMMIVKSER